MANRDKVTRPTEAHVDAQLAAMEEYGDELQRETLRCENSTAEAIRAAPNAQKLSELHSGLEMWKKALGTSATRYYKTCFELGRRNMDDLGGKKPADFAYERATTGLSLFLHVSALDGKEETLDGRVPEFIQHVCGDWSDLWGNPSDVLGDSAPTPVFQLPWWSVRRGIGSKIAGLPMKPPNGDESSTLSVEESETFILGAQSSVTSALCSVLSRSHRKALIATGMSTLSSSKQEPPVASVATNMADLPTASESEHLDALNRLNRLFGSELWKAKTETSAAAFKSLRAIDNDDAKRDELGKHFLAWRERVAAAIHKWVVKYFAIARSNPAVAGSAGKWVEKQVLSRLRAQCIGYEGRSTFTKDGVTYLEPLEWWMRCACDGKPRLPERPWDPPDWIVPIYDSLLLHHASLTRELMSELDVAIVDAFQVGNEREAPDHSAGRVDPTTEFVDRAMRQMDRGSRLIDNFRLEQQEQHRREMERLDRDRERARELAHARKMAEIKQSEITNANPAATSSQARELNWRDQPAPLEEIVVQDPRATKSEGPKPETGFDCSEDYRSIHYLRKPYTLTRNQAVMLRILREAHETGHPDVDKERLLKAIENETSKVRDSWKSSGLWQKLVISGQRRGTYRLSLPSAHSKSVAKIPPLKDR